MKNKIINLMLKKGVTKIGPVQLVPACYTICENGEFTWQGKKVAVKQFGLKIFNKTVKN